MVTYCIFVSFFVFVVFILYNILEEFMWDWCKKFVINVINLICILISSFIVVCVNVFWRLKRMYVCNKHF